MREMITEACIISVEPVSKNPVLSHLCLLELEILDKIMFLKVVIEQVRTSKR